MHRVWTIRGNKGQAFSVSLVGTSILAFVSSFAFQIEDRFSLPSSGNNYTHLGRRTTPLLCRNTSMDPQLDQTISCALIAFYFVSCACIAHA